MLSLHVSRFQTVSPSPLSKREEEEESFNRRIVQVGGGLSDQLLDSYQSRRRANKFLELGVRNEMIRLYPWLAKRRSPQCWACSTNNFCCQTISLLVVATRDPQGKCIYPLSSYPCCLSTSLVSRLSLLPHWVSGKKRRSRLTWGSYEWEVA